MSDREQQLHDDQRGRRIRRSRNKTKSGRGFAHLRSFALEALICVAIIYVLFAFIVGITSMPNADMYPRLDPGDFLLYYRLDKDPKAQDIVVLEKNGTTYVGRVVAVQGDTIEITDEGSVLINGYTMQETNIFSETYPLKKFVEYPVKLGKEECFVLADKRGSTEDSRFYGPVRYDELKGTVISVMRRSNL